MKTPRKKKMTKGTPKVLSSSKDAHFDDALPERLHGSTGKTAERHLSIVHADSPKLSPYVIKLTRGNEAPQVSSASRIDQLAKSLVFDATEDDALPELLTDDVLASAEEIRAQLRDADRVAAPMVTTTGQVVRHAEHVGVGHVPHAPVTPEDLRALLVAFDGEEDDTDVTVSQESTLPIAAMEGDVVVFTEEAIEPDTVIVTSVETPQYTPHEEPMQHTRTAFFTLPHNWRRALAGFMALSFMVVLPLHAMQAIGGVSTEAEDISSFGRAAVDDLTRGASAFADARYDLAQDQFSRAAAKFAQAEDELATMHAAIAAVVNVIPQTDRTYDSVSGLITAGRELSTVASTMSKAAETIAPATAIDVVTKLELLATAAVSAAPHATAAAAALEKVDPSVIPADYTDRVTQLKAYAPQLSAALNEFTSFSNALATMLGGDGAMRYLVAFQNSTELRPTGGFIGSFAEIDVRHGAIENMRVPGGGTYDVQGQLTEFVASPTPLSIINPRWELQDANWFPDFPTSARKIQWFYENAGGPTTDGVIAVNATFVVNLLAILGPVEMTDYGVTIDAENFMFEAQKAVEITYDKEANTPKAFIGDLAPVLLERITEADMPTFLAILDLVGQSLAQKDIQLYFRGDELQAAMNELGWSGAMKQTVGDYLMVVNTNLGGGKTDAVIDQNVDVDVTVRADGSVENTVTVTKIHHGIANALFTGKNNVDYLRLYVPEGSELLAADGFEAPLDSAFELSDVPLSIDEDLILSMSAIDKDLVSGTDSWNENGKTVFGNWMQTAPGETQVVRFTYRLPFTVNPKASGILAAAEAKLGFGGVAPYTLFVQKQSGADTRVTNVHVALPDAMTAVFTSDADLTSTGGLVLGNSEDRFFRMLLEHE